MGFEAVGMKPDHRGDTLGLDVAGRVLSTLEEAVKKNLLDTLRIQGCPYNLV